MAVPHALVESRCERASGLPSRIQGASYFRAVAKEELYGLSARGLSISTGETKGEEFPAFKTYWIEKPAANAKSIVVHALTVRRPKRIGNASERPLEGRLLAVRPKGADH